MVYRYESDFLYQYITSLLIIYNIQILLHGPHDLLVSGIWGTYLSGFAVIRGEISIKGGMFTYHCSLIKCQHVFLLIDYWPKCFKVVVFSINPPCHSQLNLLLCIYQIFEFYWDLHCNVSFKNSFLGNSLASNTAVPHILLK